MGWARYDYRVHHGNGCGFYELVRGVRLSIMFPVGTGIPSSLSPGSSVFLLMDMQLLRYKLDTVSTTCMYNTRI